MILLDLLNYQHLKTCNNPIFTCSPDITNAGEQLVYISSANWMTRNIERRIEVGCFIYCAKVRKSITNIINTQLVDNCKVWVY